VETGAFRAFASSLVLEEVAFKILLQSASNHVDKVTVHSVKRLIGEPEKRREVVAPLVEYMGYVRLLRRSGLTVIEVTANDALAAVDKVLAYGLMTADAVHLVVMERKGIHHLASSDGDFEAVEGITVWSPHPAVTEEGDRKGVAGKRRAGRK
jgi:predicted nucleic acid-binding protein